MKKTVLFLALLSFAIVCVRGQTEKSQTIYLFPQFENATVYLKNGQVQTKMNYNIFADEMVFIDGRDTLLLADKNNVSSIMIAKRTFVYLPQRGFLELIGATNDIDVCLAIQHKVKYLGSKSTGAYGASSDLAATNTISSLGMQNNSSVLYLYEGALNESYKRDNVYFLKSGKNYKIANRSGFLQSFPVIKKQLENYLVSDPVDFSSSTDLIRLYYFCITSSPSEPKI